MSNNYARTIAAIQKMIIEMQYLVDHPRMQQRNWVARGREWLPVLHHAIEDLSQADQSNTVNQGMSYPAPEIPSLLIKVNVRDPNTYINIPLNEVKSVTVYRGGEPGHRYQRGAHSGFELKNGHKYLTNPDEAQRLVDALNKYNAGN